MIITFIEHRYIYPSYNEIDYLVDGKGGENIKANRRWKGRGDVTYQWLSAIEEDRDGQVSNFSTQVKSFLKTLKSSHS